LRFGGGFVSSTNLISCWNILSKSLPRCTGYIGSLNTSGNVFYNVYNVFLAKSSYYPCISPSPWVPKALRCVKLSCRSSLVTKTKYYYVYCCFFSPRIYYLSEHNSNVSFESVCCMCEFLTVLCESALFWANLDVLCDY
jgi:hypothetical protein